MAKQPEKDVVRVLNKFCDELGIGKGERIGDSSPAEAAEMVDLDISYKLLIVEIPVTNDEDELIYNPPDVTKNIVKRPDGQYEIRWTGDGGPDFKIVSATDMKVMRARFLLLKGFYIQNFDNLTLPKQNEIAAKYDIQYILNFEEPE